MHLMDKMIRAAAGRGTELAADTSAQPHGEAPLTGMDGGARREPLSTTPEYGFDDWLRAAHDESRERRADLADLHYRNRTT